jgi:hypothetical protein
MTFPELRSLITACILPSGGATPKFREFVTSNENTIANYIERLAQVAEAEPKPPTLPPYEPWPTPSTWGAGDPNQKKTRQATFMDFERRRQETYERERREYKQIIAAIVDSCALQQRIIRSVRAEFAAFKERQRAMTPSKLYWRLLPSGEPPFPKLLEYYEIRQRANPGVVYDITRLRAVHSLLPTRIYVGADEFDGYVVFLFSVPSYAVLECPLRGNAIYVIRRDWQQLSKLTKSELLERHSDDIVRIVHSGDWFVRLKKIFATA